MGPSNYEIEGPLNNDGVRLCVSVLSYLRVFAAGEDLRIDDESIEIELAERKLC